MIRIVEYDNRYHDEVVEHILEIQNNEFHLGLTSDEQSDLKIIEESYIATGGNFWLGLNEEGKVVGTIAIYNLGNSIGYLRKMFVKPAYRGREAGVSQPLLDTLIHWAVAHNYNSLYLETISVFKAAVKFYLKNNFVQIEPDELPENFVIIKVAEFFFRRVLV